MSALPDAYHEALRGDLRVLPAWLATDPGPEWSFAASALAWMAQPERFPRPTPNAHVPSAGDGALDGLAEGHAVLARAALLAMDFGAMRAAADALSSLASARAPRAVAWLHIVEGHSAVLADAPASARGHADAAHALAMDHKWSTLLVEAVLLRAVAHMASGEIAEATVLARRASRMAQTEHIWLSHYFASVILARLRRLASRPHLAGLISAACLEAAPQIFGGWLRWEMLFAGVMTPPNERTPADRAATLAGAALAGGLADTGLATLHELVAPSVLHRVDIESALAATGVGPVTGDAETRAWCSGETVEPPPRLSGLTPPAWCDSSLDAAPAAIAGPGGLRRRVLGFAVPAEYARVQPLGSRPARPESVAAALTLASDGITRPELFEKVYGFAYRRELHETSFKFVRHQAKKLLEPYADVVSVGELVLLEVKRPFALIDPRCRQPMQDLMLRYLATSGALSAKDLAKRLDVPLRTVQLALREMTDDGVCVAERSGRQVSYVVEDTTFCALTMA